MLTLLSAPGVEVKIAIVVSPFSVWSEELAFLRLLKRPQSSAFGSVVTLAFFWFPREPVRGNFESETTAGSIPDLQFRATLSAASRTWEAHAFPDA
jgi:hypothetical protein